MLYMKKYGLFFIKNFFFLIKIFIINYFFKISISENLIDNKENINNNKNSEIIGININKKEFKINNKILEIIELDIDEEDIESNNNSFSHKMFFFKALIIKYIKKIFTIFFILFIIIIIITLLYSYKYFYHNNYSVVFI